PARSSRPMVGGSGSRASPAAARPSGSSSRREAGSKPAAPLPRAIRARPRARRVAELPRPLPARATLGPMGTRGGQALSPLYPAALACFAAIGVLLFRFAGTRWTRGARFDETAIQLDHGTLPRVSAAAAHAMSSVSVVSLLLVGGGLVLLAAAR